MVSRHISREGIASEQRRVELLTEVARHQSIAAARSGNVVDLRPFAAPGSFLVFLKKHFASGRFHPASPNSISPSPAGGTIVR